MESPNAWPEGWLPTFRVVYPFFEEWSVPVRDKYLALPEILGLWRCKCTLQSTCVNRQKIEKRRKKNTQLADSNFLCCLIYIKKIIVGVTLCSGEFRHHHSGAALVKIHYQVFEFLLISNFQSLFISQENRQHELRDYNGAGRITISRDSTGHVQWWLGEGDLKRERE